MAGPFPSFVDENGVPTPVKIARDSSGNPIIPTSSVSNSTSSTPTQSSVASSATNVTLLAANTARKGATITNDSSAVLYIKLGATASATSYTVTLAGSAGAPFSYFEVPFGYVGIIDGIWASATGNARITEIV